MCELPSDPGGFMKETFSTVNPRTGKVLHSYSYTSYEAAESAIRSAHEDFLQWREHSFAQRAECLHELAAQLESRIQDFIKIMGEEMGKAPAEAKAEVLKCVQTCRYYAENAENILRAQDVDGTPYAKAQVRFLPLGVIFCIMPWNFPLWQVIRFAAPTLMAGNTILLKHAEITAGTAVLLEEVFSGLSTSLRLLRNIQVSHSTAERVIAHPHVRGVTFTGSTEGGRKVAVNAAANLKKHVLELGGSDPYLIFADANIPRAAELCAKARLQNAGQSCVAAKRFIVVREVAEDFIESLKGQMKNVDLAPLASKRFQQQLHNQVGELIQRGGRLELGGALPEGAGAFYPATLIVCDAKVSVQEEFFGPVAIVIVVESMEEALDVANSTPYGLGGAVFTQDAEAAEKVLQKMDAGFVVINDFVKSDAHIPFGGVKNSGYGRELGVFGILEFANIKTCVWSGMS